MVHEVMGNKELRMLTPDSLIQILGQPDRRAGNYLYYTLRKTHWGPITLHTRTLVILYNENQCVEWMKLHQ